MLLKKCCRGKKMRKLGKGLYLGPYRGRGLLNSLINNMPFNLTIPGTNYCGPNRAGHLEKNLPPKNKLDSYCKEHDVFYKNNPDIAARNKADLKLAEQAWSRLKANDSSFGEKASAYAVTNLMKAKAKLGMGLKFKNKNNGQFSVARGKPTRSLLSRSISKKSVKKTKTKTKRKRNN